MATPRGGRIGFLREMATEHPWFNEASRTTMDIMEYRIHYRNET